MDSLNIITKQAKDKIRSLFQNRTLRTDLLLLVIALSLIVVIFFIREKTQEETVQLKPIPTPRINTYFTGKYRITLTQSAKNTQIPQKLPIYETNPDPLDSSFIENLKLNLGLSQAEVIESEDKTYGTTLVYSYGGKYLRIVPGKQLIDFKTGIGEKETFPNLISNETKQKLTDIALQYLKSNGFIEGDLSLTPYKIRALYFYFEEIQPSNIANVISITFTAHLDEYKVMPGTFETGLVHITFNSEDKIMSVRAESLPSLNRLEERNVKDFFDIQRQISTTSLQSLDDGKIDVTKLNPDSIKSIIINGIEIVYLKELQPDQQILQPVFLLEGTATLKNNQKVNTSLYLPALK